MLSSFSRQAEIQDDVTATIWKTVMQSASISMMPKKSGTINIPEIFKICSSTNHSSLLFLSYFSSNGYFALTFGIFWLLWLTSKIKYENNPVGH